jgi:LmbE family N-acetylglucosaminyl deacetylase
MRRGAALRQRVSERRFQSRLRFDPAAPALLLSPHWDDAVLSCWSVLHGDGDLTVVNVFAGMPPSGRLTRWDEITGARESLERALERAEEDAEAMRTVSRESLDLPFLELEYREPSPPHRLSAIDRALASHVDRASRLYVPAGIGGHPDHLLTRLYGRMLVGLGIPVFLYAELPYCVLHGWPHWVDGRPPDRFRNVDAFWRSFLVGVPEMPPLQSATVTSFDAGEASAKLSAMRCYQSQLPSLDPGAGGLLQSRSTYGFEVLWDLIRPAV